MPLDIAVIGTGHVGLITAATLARVGHTVLAIDESFLAPPPDQLPTGKGSFDSGGPITIEPLPASDLPQKESSTGG